MITFNRRERSFLAEYANLIQGMLRHDPADSPRNMGGMIELLYELQVAAEQPLNDVQAIEYLKANKKGGKLGKFAKKLVEYQA